MHDYCTLFDKNYLIFGLALHASLRRQHNGPFRLFMLAMDETCEAALRALRLDHVVVVSLDEVVTPEFRVIRERMTFGQLCWTCQPLLCKHLLELHGAAEITYLEADSYFFSDPQVLFDEIGPRSISLVPHAYAPAHDQTATSGVFCVQFNLFRNDAHGREFLAVWQDACLQYDKQRTGHYPGQLCMNDWPTRSRSVCVVKNPGAGVAPWNVSRYRIGHQDDVPTVDGRPIVFYHFHELAFMDRGRYFLSSYALSPEAVRFIYQPYLVELERAWRQLRRALPAFDHRKAFRSPGLWTSLLSFDGSRVRSYLRFQLLRFKGRRNILRPFA